MFIGNPYSAASVSQMKLKSLAILVLAASTGLAGLQAADTNRVVAVTDPAAVNLLEVAPDRVPPMVRAGLCALTGAATETEAWSALVAATDVVGIKVNTAAAPLQATRPAVVNALVDGLLAAGVASTNIVVWDLNAINLRRAGFQSNDRYQVRAVMGDSGWNADRYHESDIVGKLIWGDLLYGQTEDAVSTRSHFPKLLTQTITKLINVPVLQDHETYGISGCLYNLTVGAVDNSRRFAYGVPPGLPDIPLIAAHAEIRDKTILHVMDALIAGYAGGPSFKPRYSWAPATLYFSRDPVAIDGLCLGLLESQRAAARIPALDKRALHVVASGRAGLGQADTNQVAIVRVNP